MPRTVQVTVPSGMTDQLIGEMRQVSGLIGLRVQRQTSVYPPGDVITVELINRSLHDLIRLLDRHKVGKEPGGSITISEPISVVSSSMASSIVRDTSESTWEEMEVIIGKESNMTPNGLLLMAISGVLAATGIATNSLHIVIAAMVIAPGFEPISRISLGVVSGSSAWQRGLSNTALGYAALTAGAMITTQVLYALGRTPLGGGDPYLPTEFMIDYWTSTSVPALTIAAVAGAAGAILIATNRSVLTAGVMIALALIPASTITGMALVSGEMGLALKSLLRWLIEVAFVAGFSGLVFLWKRSRVQQRRMAL